MPEVVWPQRGRFFEGCLGSLNLSGKELYCYIFLSCCFLRGLSRRVTALSLSLIMKGYTIGNFGLGTATPLKRRFCLSFSAQAMDICQAVIVGIGTFSRRAGIVFQKSLEDESYL